MDSVLLEKRVLDMLAGHPNITTLYCTFQDAEHLCIFFFPALFLTVRFYSRVLSEWRAVGFNKKGGKI